MEGLFQVAALSLLTLVINIPMGFWRALARKFSIQWFVAIHVFVPVIILMRLKGGISDSAIPLLIVAALVGQATGVRVCRMADNRSR